ncbi:MAG: hypothetical protein JW720_03835 [Sedimentisphaerales bacterium]|nr:hypothetical protein [Sedimentisphaerales bacterium]
MKAIYVALAMLFSLTAASSSKAVDTTAIDAVRKKEVLAQQDLQIIDGFWAAGVEELVRTREFTDIARLRTILLSRQSTQKQYAQQFSASALTHITSGLRLASTLPPEVRVKVTMNLLILIDGLADLRLVNLSAASLANRSPVVRYWAVHSLTNPRIIAQLSAGGAAGAQRARVIAEKLEELVGAGEPEILALILQFADGVKISQTEELLLKIADERIRQYAAWKVKYELLDSTVLNLLSDKMIAGSTKTSAVAYRFAQLYSCAFQRYIVGQSILSDVQKGHLASVLVGTEANCIVKLLGAPQSTIKRAIERGDAAALSAEHNKLLGVDTKAGALAAKVNFVYGPDASGKSRNAPFSLPMPKNLSPQK